MFVNLRHSSQFDCEFIHSSISLTYTLPAPNKICCTSGVMYALFPSDENKQFCQNFWDSDTGPFNYAAIYSSPDDYSDVTGNL